MTTRLGVQALLAEGIDLLIHLGDVGSVEVVDELAVHQPAAPGIPPENPGTPATGDQVPARLVFGNSDWDLGPLQRYANTLGIQVDHPVGRLQLDPGELVFCHGHQAQVMTQALAQDVRYLCHGHTHQASDSRSGSTRIINPGALCRAHRYTVAVLDTQADQLTFLTVPPH